MSIVKKPKDYKELGKVDISGLKDIISSLTENFWKIEDSRKENDFPVFHHTQHIIFRFIHRNLNHNQYYSNPIWDIWKPILIPIMNQAIEPYNFKSPTYPKAMFARLKAGHIIDQHIDGRGSNLHTHKIHIPIETNPKAIFSIMDSRKHLEQGIAYEVNNVVLHGVENLGESDRIHFIFEVYDDAKQ